MQITETAAERMREAVIEEINEEGRCFRIAMSEDGVELVVDEHREGDIAFEYEGTLVLVLDELAAEAAGEFILDFDAERSELLFCTEDEFESVEELDPEEPKPSDD